MDRKPDAKINSLAKLFNIKKAEDWIAVLPDSVLAKPNVGNKALDHLRLWLADQGLTLRDDRTPDYWQKMLATSRESGSPIACPFVVLIDSAEKHPFTFTGLRTGAALGNRPLDVQTEIKSLGPAHGDYSIRGYEGSIHIERKSMDDAHGTILGWGEHRERFERELEYLESIEFGAVVIECTLGELLNNAPARGRKSADENKLILNQQYIAWLLKYRSVKWIFCDSRRLAEIETFRLFEKFVAYKLRTKKNAEKRSAKTADQLAFL
jgi:hypothetical protein